MDSSDFKRLFPEAEVLTAIGELSAWTSTDAILAAARGLEGRPASEDQLEPMLVIPFSDETPVFERILEQAVAWFVAAYKPPAPKIALARAMDPRISDDTARRLQAARFKPDIDRAAPGVVSSPKVEGPCLIVRDEPWVIEMVQAPLISMIDMLKRFEDNARQTAVVLDTAEEKTGGAARVFHRPYADSKLPAILDALCFYHWQLAFGPVWGEPGASSIDMAYRAVNVHGVPPLDPRFLKVARQSMELMLDSLR